MWRITQADLEVSRDTLEQWIWGVAFRVRKNPGDAPFFMRARWMSGLGLASLSDWGLMKTNDLTRSKGWDQGQRMPLPSQLTTWEINEGREQPLLCILYSLRPQNLMIGVQQPTCEPIKALWPWARGHLSWLGAVTALSQHRHEHIVFTMVCTQHLQKLTKHFFLLTL